MVYLKSGKLRCSLYRDALVKGRILWVRVGV